MIDDLHSLDVVYELAVNRRFIDPAIVLALIAELRASRQALNGCANVAHLAWEDPPTIRQAFKRIEEIAQDALK